MADLKDKRKIFPNHGNYMEFKEKIQLKYYFNLNCNKKTGVEGRIVLNQQCENETEPGIANL